MASVIENVFTQTIKCLKNIIIRGFLNLYRGSFHYFATSESDTIGDWRLKSTDAGTNGIQIQSCTADNATKGGGTWKNIIEMYPSGDLYVSGFTQLGELGRGIKTKSFTSNTLTIGFNYITHNLTMTKIQILASKIQYDASLQFPAWSEYPQRSYSLGLTPSSIVVNLNSTATDVIGKKIEILIAYTE